MTASQIRASELAGTAIRLLISRGQTIAAAESLTGGLVAAALTAIPGASAAFRGGVVAYAADLKAAVLGVPDDLLARHGAVHPRIAEAMAEGARTRMWTTVGIATTGVAGPDPAEGRPVGTVYIAVAGPARTTCQALALTGNRESIRVAAVESVLDLLLAAMREDDC